MANVDVVTTDNSKAGSLDLDPAVFEAKVRPHLYHAEVRRQLANRRLGNHSTKNRAAVSGGGAKPYNQKGTGRARQGTTRAPQWSGGGVAFGPVPHGYTHKLPKKVRRAALTSALTELQRDGAITVIEQIELDDYKTKRMVEIFQALGVAGQKVLLVLDSPNAIVEASVRNLPGVGLVRAEGLNVYDVLRHGRIVITKAALESVQARLAGKGKEAAE
jgi:large subunit ribosomal protein L4